MLRHVLDVDHGTIEGPRCDFEPTQSCSEEPAAQKQKADNADACQMELLKGRPKFIIFDKHAEPSEQCYGLSSTCTPDSEALVVQMCEVKYPPSEDPGLQEEIKRVLGALQWLSSGNDSIPNIQTLLDEANQLSGPLEGTLIEHQNQVNTLRVKVADAARKSLKASVNFIRKMDGFDILIAEGDELVNEISGELTANHEQRIKTWKAAVANAAKNTLKVSVASIRNLDGFGPFLDEAIQLFMPKAEEQQPWDDSRKKLILITLQNMIKSFAESDGLTWAGAEAKSRAALAKLVLQEFVKQFDAESEEHQKAQEELTNLQEVTDMDEELFWQKIQKWLDEWRAKLTKPQDSQDILKTSQSHVSQAQAQAQAQAEKERKFQEAKKALEPWLHDAMKHMAPAKKQKAEQLWQGLQIGFVEASFKHEINALKTEAEGEGYQPADGERIAAADRNLKNTIQKLQDGPAKERAKRLGEPSDESSAIKMRTMLLLPISVLWLSTQ